jgi:hypothetical protein
MSADFSLYTSKNKDFVINNKKFLKQYALKNHSFLGKGIVVINLLLLKINIIDETNALNCEIQSNQEITVNQPISYIPQNNFWFKMLSLKIKKKHNIDLQAEENTDNKFLVVFVKDASIEHFSIYSLKI